MMVSAHALTKTYSSSGTAVGAVEDASFEIGSGEFVSVMGHSGSGKSTLLSLIGGLTKPTSGSVLLGGTDLSSLSDDDLSGLRNRSLSFIYQFSSLVGTLDVLDNVLLPTAFGRFPFPETSDRAIRLLETVGLGDRLGAYPSELSGGQQRRVAIARAFINSPALILADEPTGDLDEETEVEVMRFFRETNRREGVTFVMVTHNPELAKGADRSFRMDRGRLASA